MGRNDYYEYSSFRKKEMNAGVEPEDRNAVTFYKVKSGGYVRADDYRPYFGELQDKTEYKKVNGQYQPIKEDNQFMGSTKVGGYDNINESEPYYVVHPDSIIKRALMSRFINIDEATDPQTKEIAQEIAAEWGQRYEGSGQGFGSSDHTFLMQDFLNALGKETEFVDNKLTVKDNGMYKIPKPMQSLSELSRGKARDAYLAADKDIENNPNDKDRITKRTKQKRVFGDYVNPEVEEFLYKKRVKYVPIAGAIVLLLPSISGKDEVNVAIDFMGTRYIKGSENDVSPLMRIKVREISKFIEQHIKDEEERADSLNELSDETIGDAFGKTLKDMRQHPFDAERMKKRRRQVTTFADALPKDSKDVSKPAYPVNENKKNTNKNMTKTKNTITKQNLMEMVKTSVNELSTGGMRDAADAAHKASYNTKGSDAEAYKRTAQGRKFEKYINPQLEAFLKTKGIEIYPDIHGNSTAVTIMVPNKQGTSKIQMQVSTTGDKILDQSSMSDVSRELISALPNIIRRIQRDLKRPSLKNVAPNELEESGAPLEELSTNLMNRAAGKAYGAAAKAQDNNDPILRKKRMNQYGKMINKMNPTLKAFLDAKNIDSYKDNDGISLEMINASGNDNVIINVDKLGYTFRRGEIQDVPDKLVSGLPNIIKRIQADLKNPAPPAPNELEESGAPLEELSTNMMNRAASAADTASITADNKNNPILAAKKGAQAEKFFSAIDPDLKAFLDSKNIVSSKRGRDVQIEFPTKDGAGTVKIVIDQMNYYFESFGVAEIPADILSRLPHIIKRIQKNLKNPVAPPAPAENELEEGDFGETDGGLYAGNTDSMAFKGDGSSPSQKMPVMEDDEVEEDETIEEGDDNTPAPRRGVRGKMQKGKMNEEDLKIHAELAVIKEQMNKLNNNKKLLF